MNRSILILFLLIATSIADRRSYVWTYQYMTNPAGHTELELYQTTKLKPMDVWEFRFEIEHGFTDNWDFSVYQIFEQKEGDSFKWNAVQFRTRYRFGEAGRYFLDPLLYIEFNRKLDLKEPNKFELKLILARDIGAYNISVNPLFEYFFAPGQKSEIGMDTGISFEFSPQFIAGVESVTRLEFEDVENELATYLGPTISFASGKWWYNVGIIFGLNEKADDARIRFLMGIGL